MTKCEGDLTFWAFLSFVDTKKWSRWTHGLNHTLCVICDQVTYWYVLIVL